MQEASPQLPRGEAFEVAGDPGRRARRMSFHEQVHVTGHELQHRPPAVLAGLRADQLLTPAPDPADRDRATALRAPHHVVPETATCGNLHSPGHAATIRITSVKRRQSSPRPKDDSPPREVPDGPEAGSCGSVTDVDRATLTWGRWGPGSSWSSPTSTRPAPNWPGRAWTSLASRRSTPGDGGKFIYFTDPDGNNWAVQRSASTSARRWLSRPGAWVRAGRPLAQDGPGSGAGPIARPCPCPRR
jgi:hypothetical protein